jgi:RimJ/RimL family protein N-acetyltransferase
MTDAAKLTPGEIMQLHIETLFCLNAHGQLRCINEIGEPPAPILYMGRTLQGNVYRFRDDLPSALVDELEQLCRAEPVAARLDAPAQNEAGIRAAIEEFLPHRQQSEYRGPAYWIPETRRMTRNVVWVSETNSHLIRETFPWLVPLLSERELGPVTAAVEQGRAVALCFCSRRPGRAVEAGVETLPAFRGKGYATATVGAWAAEVSRRGIIPLYSTSWDNLASQAVAHKLGMVQYGEGWSIHGQ